jgi:DNA repair protein SbcC/Rad50
MLITRIDLENAKSYRQQTASFAQGTNAICGENGAGKTTLVEAIGFALFDYLPNNKSSFVREGEKTATITVTFISSHDEREYQVVRRAGSRGDYYVYDPEIDAKLVEGKADVSAWLRQHLGVEATTDLSALFRDAIGVPQGLFTAAFLDRPAQRKPVFDRLLRVDEYARAYTDSRETISYAKDQIAQTANRVAALQATVDRLPGLRQYVTTMQQEKVELEERQSSLGDTLTKTAQRLQTLEAVAQNVMALSQEVERRKTRLQTLTDRLAAAQSAAAQSRQAQSELQQSQAGHAAYVAAQEAAAAMEQERAQRDKLQTDIAALEKTQAGANTRIAQLHAELQAAAEAQQSLAQLAPHVTRQEALEKERDDLKQAVLTLQQRTQQRAEREQEANRIAADLQRVQAGLAQAAQLEAQQQADRAALAQAQADHSEQSTTLAELRAEWNRLKEQAKTLAQIETAQCPVCEQPLTPEHRQRLQEENRARETEVEARGQELKAAVEALTAEIARLQQAVEKGAAQLRRLPRADEEKDLQEKQAAAAVKLADIEAEIAAVGNVQEDLTRIEADLAGLGDPRRQHDLLSAQAARAETLQQTLTAEQETVAAIEENLRQIATAMAPFAGLDARLTQQRQVLQQNLADYQRYLSNSQLAAQLPEREQEVETLTAETADAQTQAAEAQTEHESAASGFDPTELEQVRQLERALNREQASIQGQVAALQRQLDHTVQEIEGLQQQEGALTEAKKQQSEQQRLMELLQLFREAIRSAGPHVIRRLAQQISLQATRLYADILADHTCRLIWREDYGIQMERDGRTRDFEMLSGGEQMAAALSIRLALLQELSDIDVAFFDEPTTNLDETRRENLAQQIGAIRGAGFSQVFVISHDDTFEQATDHIVRVTKHNGESQVELG